MKKSDNKVLDKMLRDDKIPYEGSLGLLALGDLGIKYWRFAKEQNEKNLKK